jgi:predicted dehydrogenase
MTKDQPHSASRRGFLKSTGQIAAGPAIAGGILQGVHAAENNMIQVALVGSGGRGTGAARDALTVKNGPIKLIAIADVFEQRVARSYQALQNVLERQGANTDKGDVPFTADQVDVPPDRRFVGFDAYKQAMDCLDPGDIVILTTPPAFRWPYFSYAIQKNLNVFMEKPVTVDGPTTKKMLKLADVSEQKNMKVGVGLMCRHTAARRELFDRIQDGQLGDVLSMRSYRMHGPDAYFRSLPKPEGISELLYQIQRFHSFLWASGGCFSDFYIHFIDECCWMKDTWPIKAQGLGGRHQREKYVDQNFDQYSVEYTFADDTRLFFYGRSMDGCYGRSASYVHGSKGIGVISNAGHHPAKCRIYRGQKLDQEENLVWAFPQPEAHPYLMEWEHLIEAIRQDKPYNEARFGAESSLVTSMGRMAAHTGQEITFDQMLNCDHEFAPNVDEMTMNTPAPIQLEPDGKYPFPEPGVKSREY